MILNNINDDNSNQVTTYTRSELNSASYSEKNKRVIHVTDHSVQENHVIDYSTDNVFLVILFV